MEALVVILRASVLLLVLGIALFGFYLRSRKPWAWGVAVALMVAGSLGLTFFFGP